MKTKQLINLLLTLGLFSACSGGTNTAPVPTAQKTPTPILEETFERPLDVDNPAPGCGYGDSPCAANPKETLNIVHAGVDYWGDPKQTYPEDEKRPVIFSSAPGYVVAIIHNEIGCKPPPAKGDCDDHGLGNTVIMKHVLADSREEIYTLYAHLEKIDSSLEENFKSLSEGESLCVDQHTTLGIMGASGYGQQNWWTKLDPPMPHLHLEFKIRGILSNPSGGGTKYSYVSSNPPDDWGYRNPNDYIDKKSALTCYGLTKSAQNPTVVSPSTPTPPIPVPGATPIRTISPAQMFSVGDYFVYDTFGWVDKTEFIGTESVEGYNTWFFSSTRDTSADSTIKSFSYKYWVDQETGIIVKAEYRSIFYVPRAWTIAGQHVDSIETTEYRVYDLRSNSMEGGNINIDTEGKQYESAYPSLLGYLIFMITRNLQIGDWYPWETANFSSQVIGEESVSVPAGTFDCWVVREVPQDYQYVTQYFDKSTGILVKEEFWSRNNGVSEKNGERALVSFNWSALKPKQALVSLALPRLNRAEYFSVLQWIKYAALNNDISVFEQLIVGNSIQLIDGSNAAVNINKADFLSELSTRLTSKPNCEFFMFEESGRLVVRISNWSPGWGVDGNTIVYLILEMRNNQWVLTSVVYGDYLPSWAQGLERISFDTISLSVGITTDAVCKEARPTRLKIGDFAFISFYPPLNQRVRSGPGTSNSILDVIPVGSAVKILDGPQCADNWVWWKVRVLSSKLEGWTSEGDKDAYWLIPCESRDGCGTQ